VLTLPKLMADGVAVSPEKVLLPGLLLGPVVLTLPGPVAPLHPEERAAKVSASRLTGKQWRFTPILVLTQSEHMTHTNIGLWGCEHPCPDGAD
jgi:hypothetical protein